MAVFDLITSTYATNFLAAAGRYLTTAQSAVLASKITEASQTVCRWCGDRDFTRQTYDETYRPSLEGTVELKQIPVNSVIRVSGGRTTGLTVFNNSSSNVRSTVGFTFTGDEDSGITFTGLALICNTGGVDVEVDLTYASYPTLGQLATAVNALGYGWSATAAVNLTNWPSAELAGGDVFQDATGTGAELQIYAEIVGGCKVDRKTGELTVGIAGGSSAVDSPRWGPYQDPADSAWQARVRVIYDAGFATIPLPVQEATALVVSKLFDDSGRDLSVQSETVGRGSYTIDPNSRDMVSREIASKLAPYRIFRT